MTERGTSEVQKHSRVGHELAGKTAFVTGGAQGIGLGIARACASRGMNVAIVDRDTAALELAERELSAITDVVAIALDVRDRDAFAAAADEAEVALGPVALLCNNAGVAGNVQVTNMSYEAWDWVVGINLTGVYNGIQTFVPRMLDRGGGHIVNTASGAGLLCAHSGFLYAASKAGVVGMSEALRTELAKHGIGVSVLCPSAVATNIITNTTGSAPSVDDAHPSVMDGMDDHLRFFAKMLAAGADPDDVGRMVVEGVERDQLYILTDDVLGEWLEKRTAEIIAVMPAPAGT